MPSVIVDICDLVVGTLNDAIFELDFTAERLYVPVRDLREVTQLRVSVVPSELGFSGPLANRRGDATYQYTIDIGIQASIGAGTMTDIEIRDACDPYMRLAQDIGDLFVGEQIPLPGYDPPPRCSEMRNEPVFVAQHLEEYRVFTGVVTLVFKLGR